MDLDVTRLTEINSENSFEFLFGDLVTSIQGLSEQKIQGYFNAMAIGAKSKSLASTVRALILNDLQLKGWSTNWKPFAGKAGYETALWNFDAAKLFDFSGKSEWLTVEISFDNRIAVGTHLSKPAVANNATYRSAACDERIAHHCIVAASANFKSTAGLDSSVASAEEFALASGPYIELMQVETTLVSLRGLKTIEVRQRRSDGRLKSKLESI